MNAATMVLIALLALFVGVLIPVLIQLRSTLREAQKRMDLIGERIDTILKDSQIVANRLARASAGLDGSEHSISDFMAAISQISKSMTRASGWIGLASSLGAVLGPTMAAAVQGFRTARAGDEVAEGEGEEESATSRPVESGWSGAVEQEPVFDEPFMGGLVDVRKQQQQHRNTTQDRSQT